MTFEWSRCLARSPCGKGVSEAPHLSARDSLFTPCPSHRLGGALGEVTQIDTREVERQIARRASRKNWVLILALVITIMQCISEEG